MDILDYVQKQSAILVMGPPRSEKSLFVRQMVVEGFRRGEKAVYILTNNFPEDIIAELGKGIGSFHIEKGMMRIIDCYTNFVGVPRPDNDVTTVVSSPAALNEISIALAKSIKDISPAFVVVDSASTILLQSPHLYEKFFQVIIGKMRSYSIKSVLLLEEGIHSEKEKAVLESLTSMTLRFIEEGREKYVEIRGMGSEQRSAYEVRDGKLTFMQLA
ncbi:MAG: hypothetical protein HYT72_02345 [Candidatus Aenigmarchaeota archaeon]|nr:hypothetical protein [Candidatus Aenigmarchaeota archaeon]